LKKPRPVRGFFIFEGITMPHRERPDKPAKGEKPQRTAYDKALGLLARREQSGRELSRKLGQGGYDRQDASQAIERLGEQGYQDDDRFAAMLVRSRSNQGYGPARIRAELRSHGIGDAVAKRLLDEAEIDWHELAATILRRRYGGPTADPAERGRRAQFLLRRGFAAATVRSLTHAEVDDAADD
jgi:regulatory protein